MPGLTPTNIIRKLGARASVRRFVCGDGEAGAALADPRALDGGVFVGEGELTERFPGLRGDGDKFTGGGKTGCLEIAVDLKLAALTERVTRLFGRGNGSSRVGALRLSGDGLGV